ncbi:hypothetical protein Q3G72_003312 [Acer saccharum]|nr:hypothetical protein Q3G72_003312 [Acer saccharum]
MHRLRLVRCKVLWQTTGTIAIETIYSLAYGGQLIGVEDKEDEEEEDDYVYFIFISILQLDLMIFIILLLDIQRLWEVPVGGPTTSENEFAGHYLSPAGDGFLCDSVCSLPTILYSYWLHQIGRLLSIAVTKGYFAKKYFLKKSVICAFYT